jgi:hypothetical protein
MDKHKLASELRECQRQLGQAPAFFIENLPDDLIIDAYVTCHDCQARLVDEDTLEKCISEELLTEEAFAQAPTIAADGPADWPDFDKLGGKPMLVPLFINEEGNVGPLDGFCRGFGAISGTEEASETTLGVYTAEGVYYNILIDGRVKCHVPTFFIDKQPYYYPIVASMTIAQGMPVVDPATGNLRSREEVQKIMAEAPAQSERKTPADVCRSKDPAKLAEWLVGDDLNLEDCPDQEALARLAVRVRRMFYQETMKTQADDGQKGS